MLLLLILQISSSLCHNTLKRNLMILIPLLDEDDEITKESVTKISVVEGSTPTKGVEPNKGI